MGNARPERLLAAAGALLCGVLAAWGREPAPAGGLLSGLGGKEPITITADRLEYDYRRNVVVYRGGVEVTQGGTRLRSDTVTVTLGPGTRLGSRPEPPAGSTPAPGEAPTTGVREIEATGRVRIEQGSRWATGGRAVYDQSRRTVVLLDDPVLHDGPNEVQGERVVVYLDEDRSVVEGGRKRVKAVLYPEAAPGAGAPAP